MHAAAAAAAGRSTTSHVWYIQAPRPCRHAVGNSIELLQITILPLPTSH